MNRREFFAAGAQTMLLALAARAIEPRLVSELQPQGSPEGLEQRLAGVIQAYDAQGNHRTGTEVDRLSAEWLAGEIRKLGLDPRLEPFPLSRVDPQSCYLRVGGR